MAVKIIAGGDSFIWGSELADSPNGSPTGYSKNTFAALLSLPYTYVCAAYPGYGNDAIARNTIQHCEKNKKGKLGVIVSWTFPGRYEFNFSFTNSSNWQTINHWTVGNQFHLFNEEHNEEIKIWVDKAKKQGIYNFAYNYFKYVGSSEYWEVYTTLKEIVFLQLYLQANNIPYMFTCADINFIESVTVKKADDTINSLYKQIDFSKWFIFPNNKGFYTWAIENKYPIGQTHPLEKSHVDAASLMKDKFNELVKKHLE